MKPLPLKQEAFVEAYLVNAGDGADAYIAAGYKCKNRTVAKACASRLLTNANVQKAVAARRTELRKVTTVTAQEVIATLASHMRGNILELLTKNGNFDVEYVRQKKMGHLIRTLHIRRETGVIRKTGRRYVHAEVIRLEVQNQQSAAVQLCKVFGIEQKKGVNENDPERLKQLLDERVNFALEGFKRGGVKLTRKDVIEMFAEAPHSAGDLYPLIQEELASVH